MSDADGRRSAAVDKLHAELLRAGENRSRARELLATAPDEQTLLALLCRALPVAFLEEIASTPPWSERPFVLARVVLNPKTPRALGLRLVGGLHWRELAQVAGAMRVSGAVRQRAEALLRDQLGELRFGDKITLARMATPALLGAFLADAESRVILAALENPHLREEDLVTALRREDVPIRLCEGVSSSPRWSASYAVRIALVLQPRTPLAIALQQISTLVPRDLRRVAEEGRLRPVVSLAARRILEGR
jgi:hypothetical protein